MGISMSGGPYSYNRFDSYEAMINEKKADKDYDGDGKVESGTEEYMGSKDKAIKKAMSKEEVDADQMALYTRALARMGGMYHPLEEKKDDEPTDERKEAADRADEEKRQKKEGKKGEAHETKELEKIEDKELAKEAFQAGWEAALAEAKGAGSPAKMAKEVKDEEEENKEETDEMKFEDKKQRRKQAENAAESYVIEHLVKEGLANNAVSAEVMMLHMSQGWFDHIISEMGPAYPSETKAQAKAQSDHREGKSSKGEKTGKNPGLKMSHTSGYNRDD